MQTHIHYSLVAYRKPPSLLWIMDLFYFLWRWVKGEGSPLPHSRLEGHGLLCTWPTSDCCTVPDGHLLLAGLVQVNLLDLFCNKHFIFAFKTLTNTVFLWNVDWTAVLNQDYFYLMFWEFFFIAFFFCHWRWQRRNKYTTIWTKKTMLKLHYFVKLC